MAGGLACTVQLRQGFDAKDVVRNIDATIPAVLEVVGTKLDAWARTLTATMRPPTRRGGPFRPAHPSPLNWADVSGQLAASYQHEVFHVGEGRWRLEWRNIAEHAVYVEARDGFAVVMGVIEPTGPAAAMIIDAFAQAAPGWEVRLGVA